MCHFRMQASAKLIILLSVAFLFFLLCSFSASAYHNDYLQVKIGSGVFYHSDKVASAPLLAIGKRFDIGDAALDLSFGYGKHKHGNGDRFSYFAFPKLLFVKFHEPEASAGYYYGGGVSISSVRTTAASRVNQTNNHHFRGVFAEGTLGYQFKQNQMISPMIYLDVSQAVVAESKRGKHPGPIVMVGLSAGF